MPEASRWLGGFDAAVMAALHDWRGPTLDLFFALVTWAGSMWLLLPAALAIGLGWGRRQPWRRAWFVTIALVGTWALAHIVKALVARPRPGRFEPLVAMPLDLSFPSAHTMQATAFVTALVLLAWPEARGRRALLVAVAAAWVLAVGVSRVYLQVHFPSDVIGGALLALAWVALAHGWLRRAAVTGFG